MQIASRVDHRIPREIREDVPPRLYRSQWRRVDVGWDLWESIDGDWRYKGTLTHDQWREIKRVKPPSPGGGDLKVKLEGAKKADNQRGKSTNEDLQSCPPVSNLLDLGKSNEPETERADLENNQGANQAERGAARFYPDGGDIRLALPNQTNESVKQLHGSIEKQGRKEGRRSLTVSHLAPSAPLGATQRKTRSHEVAPKGAKESLAQGADTMPPRGQTETNSQSTNSAPQGAKQRKPRSRKILDFAPKGATTSAPQGADTVPPGGQADDKWLKAILPPAKPGSWWETPADDKGYRLKLKWRAGGKKLPYTFRRLGKKEVEQLLRNSYDEQRALISGRIFGELFDERRPDIALKLTPHIGEYQVAGAEN